MDRVAAAVAAFEQGYSCSQSVLVAFAPSLGLDPDFAPRVAEGFGGGMARLGGTCGVVSSAVILLGLHHGRGDAPDDRAKVRTYAAIHEFLARFEAAQGASTCRGLLGYDIGTPEGLQRQKSLDHGRCAGFVREAATILVDLLAQER